MTVRTAVLVTALALSLTACGGDDPAVEADAPGTPSAPATASAPASPEAPAAPATMLTEDALTGALIAQADVPDGYASVPVEAPEDDEPLGVDCVDRISALELLGDDAPAKAAAEFELNDDAGVGHELFSFAAEDGAKELLEQARELVTDCGSFSASQDGVEISGKIVKLGLKGLGPDGIAFNATIAIGGAGVPAESFGIDLAVARAGTSISAVTFSEGTATVDHKVTERLGALGLANLRKAAEAS